MNTKKANQRKRSQTRSKRVKSSRKPKTNKRGVMTGKHCKYTTRKWIMTGGRETRSMKPVEMKKVEEGPGMKLSFAELRKQHNSEVGSALHRRNRTLDEIAENRTGPPPMPTLSSFAPPPPAPPMPPMPPSLSLSSFAPSPPAPPMPGTFSMKPANPTGNSKPSSSMANLLASRISSMSIKTNTAPNSRVTKAEAARWTAQKAQKEEAEAKIRANEAERTRLAENAAKKAPKPGQLPFGTKNLANAIRLIGKKNKKPVNKNPQTPNVSGSQTSTENLIKARISALRPAFAGKENTEEEEWD